MRYLGASASDVARKAACCSGSRGGGDVVRVATDRAGGCVVEVVRRIGRDVNGLASAGSTLVAAKGRFKLAFEDREGFFKVVSVRW